MTIRYCEGYGWHVGRPVQWIFLILGGIPFALIMVLLEAIQKAATHVTIPLSLIAPLVYLWLLRRRLKRKFAGEPFAICIRKRRL